MIPGREEYVPPVGFAREPSEQRRHWIGRVFLAAVVILLGWLLVNRVINPPDDTRSPAPATSELPGPI